MAACAGRGGSGASAPEPVSPELAETVFDSAWSRVYHTYYDTTFNGLDWTAVRDELLPVARDAGTADSLRAVINGMLDRLGDSHFAVIPEEVADALDPDSVSGAEGEPGDVGVELRVAGRALVVFRVRPDSPADSAGVRPGWTLTGIGELATRRLIDAIEEIPEDRRLAEARVAWSAEARLAGNVGDTVAAGFGTPGGPREVRMVSGQVPGTPVRFGNLPTMFADLRWEEAGLADGCAGVVAFDVWMTPILPGLEQAFEALRHCQGFVLDLRGNPGGVAGMVMGVSGYFIDERQPLGQLITRQNTLTLVSMPRRVTSAGEPMTPYDGPVAILVDGQSMSTTELFAAGMQEAGRARVFGERSGGQALPALMLRLPNGDVLMHVFANLLTPDGVRVEGRGVIPDVEVPLNREALLEGRDPVLEAAIHWIESQGGSRARRTNP
ncbi:MAG: S41 family peptidase [Candidatus Longimicrobiales bacterium M2_2A_002]